MSHPRRSPSLTPTLHQARIGSGWPARVFGPGTGRLRRLTAGFGIAALTSTLVVAGLAASAAPAYASVSAVALGSAATYAVLGATGVASTGDTIVNGDLGVSPSNSISGFGSGMAGIVNGATHAGDTQAAQAQSALALAYSDAAGRTPTGADFAGDQNGQTFTAGIYHTGAAFALTGTLTLDGQNNPNSVFIFQVNAAL